ncbi:MAG: VTT domain-containing protein [Candidatus Aenigmarchaeota archaeon]|nr:VTT domain-containing protein [Candidatus Aenigmarchaeota archaeon]
MVLSEFFAGLIAWVFGLVKAYGVWSVFFVVLMEEVFIPLPSPLVIMGAGYIIIPAGISVNEALWQSFWLIAVPASIASAIGSFFAYGIGYYGGKTLVIRLRRFLGVSWEDIKKAEKKLEKGNKVWISIAVLRAIPFFPIAIVSLASGVLRLSWKKYAVATFIGSLPRTFVLGFLGWYVGGEFVAFAGKLNLIENLVAVIVIAAVLYLLYRYRHRYRHHYQRLAEAGRKHISKISLKKK